MVTFEIEKEIKQENKVFRGLTIRQMIFGILFLGLLIAEYMIIRPTPNIMMFSGAVIATVLWNFILRKKHGIPMSYFIKKNIKTYILSNTRRKYRTKNKYVEILNNAYRQDKNSDLADSRKKKYIEKQQKKAAKKKTRLTTYM